MLSTTVIESPPSLLVIDASRNVAGWETEVCQRLYTALARRGMAMVDAEPAAVASPGLLDRHRNALERATCLLLSGQGAQASGEDLMQHWQWLVEHVAGPKLVAVCSWGDYYEPLSLAVLKESSDLAPLAIAQESPVGAREGALFFLKFFAELDLHCDEKMSGRMAWFSWSKARELLKRRRLEASFGLRA